MLWLGIILLILGSMAWVVYLKTVDNSPPKVVDSLYSDTPSPDVSQIQSQPSINPFQSLPPVVPVKTDEEKCTESGGEWSQGPLSGKFFCNQKMDDAGKSCLDGNECQSNHCYAKEASASSGICGEYQTNFGCFYQFVNGEKMPMLCAD